MTRTSEALIALPARCELAALDSLQAALIDGLATGGVVIDAAALERIDAAALQLLCVAARSAARRGVALTWRAPPAPLIAAASSLGLLQELGLPIAEVA